jgi:hypothetical protein
VTAGGPGAGSLWHCLLGRGNGADLSPSGSRSQDQPSPSVTWRSGRLLRRGRLRQAPSPLTWTPARFRQFPEPDRQ